VIEAGPAGRFAEVAIVLVWSIRAARQQVSGKRPTAVRWRRCGSLGERIPVNRCSLLTMIRSKVGWKSTSANGEIQWGRLGDRLLFWLCFGRRIGSLDRSRPGRRRHDTDSVAAMATRGIARTQGRYRQTLRRQDIVPSPGQERELSHQAAFGSFSRE